MPLIKANFSTSVSKEQEESIKTELGSAISLFPGKSETYLMVQINDNQKLYFAGKNDEPIALFEVQLLGKCSKEDCQKVTEKLCSIAKETLGISGNKVYVTFKEFDKWGFDSFMF